MQIGSNNVYYTRQKQGNPDVPTDPASTAITAILFLRICFFCYAVSTKFFTALKKPILFLRCFYYIAAPAKFLPLLLFQQCQSNSKSDVENLWLRLYMEQIRCGNSFDWNNNMWKSDVEIYLIGRL